MLSGIFSENDSSRDIQCSDCLRFGKHIKSRANACVWYADDASNEEKEGPDPGPPKPLQGLMPRRGWNRFWRAYERLATDVLQEQEVAEADLEEASPSSPVTRSQSKPSMYSGPHPSSMRFGSSS